MGSAGIAPFAAPAVGLAEFGGRATHHLSHGEKRRVCLAGVLGLVGCAASDGDTGRLADGSMRIPEHGDGVPDVLDEARWEVEFCRQGQAGLPVDGPEALGVDPVRDVPDAIGG